MFFKLEENKNDDLVTMFTIICRAVPLLGNFFGKRLLLQGLLRRLLDLGVPILTPRTSFRG